MDCIIFDTDCLLCSGMVRFVLAHETDARLNFVSAWSAAGREIAARHGLAPADLNRTFLVELDGVGYTQSAAALALATRLHRPWRFLRVLGLIPRPLRDAVYRRVADNRYRWFGRHENCLVPPPAYRHRFIDAAAPGLTPPAAPATAL